MITDLKTRVKLPMSEYAAAAKEIGTLNWVGMESDETFEQICLEGADLPFVVKGVLSVSDALKARDAGAAAIVVSHHHGRVPFGIPPVYILPQIKESLAGSGVAIFCDCSIETGYDAYKALALGADAVSVGRGILGPLLKEGRDGVVKKVNSMNAQLAELCMYTGVHDMKSFDPTVLH
ncbi:MAG: hypothetical protein DUD27_04340 [Lachnospiraceae bacterium]|nr:MAG: hypothetical protein DUD27_04340 [Lachnospiraceae bacterium]